MSYQPAHHPAYHQGYQVQPLGYDLLKTELNDVVRPIDFIPTTKLLDSA